MDRMKTRKEMIASGLVFLIILGICLFGTLFFRHSAYSQDILNKNDPPSVEHWFGTDALGRDIFFRECVGGLTSLIVASVCTIFCTAFGCLYGGIAAIKPKAGKLLFFVLDILVSIPDILLVLLLSIVFDCKTISSVCVVICLCGWCKTSRLVRDALKPLRNNDYVIQARIFGKNSFSILFFHLLPNIQGLILSRMVLSFGEFIFYESFLSYLGIGLRLPATSWGNLISEAQSGFWAHPYQLVVYCMPLVITLLSINFFGESINAKKSILPPRQTARRNIRTSASNERKGVGVFELRNLSVSFSDTNTMNNEPIKAVSFSVMPREIVGLTGCSGCGKTTLARVLSGTIGLYGGVIGRQSELYFNGQAIDLFDPHWSSKLSGKCGVSVIHQDAILVLDPTQRVGKQIRECVCLTEKGISTKEVQKRVLDYLTEVGLNEEVLQKYPYELSGGIAQRVVIAMAIAMKPILLICDEPTASLDAIHAEAITLLIKSIAEETNAAVLFISHDLSIVEKISSRVLRMEDGMVSEISDLNGQIASLPSRAEREPLASLDKHTQDTVLRVEHLEASYGEEKNILRNVSFKLKQGEVLGILGESGCGKTTLIKAIIKQLSVPSLPIILSDKSSIRSDNHDTVLHCVFQNPYSSFDPRWTLRKSFEEAISSSGSITDRRICDLLNEVGLKDEYADKTPHELSIGECQRAAIARAIAVVPDILICDEPTSSLDPDIQNSVLELLLRLITENQVTCIFISHDPQVIRYMSARIAVMYQGRIVETAPSDSFLNIGGDHHPYTKDLLGRNIREPNPALTAEDVEHGCEYALYCPHCSKMCHAEIPELQKIGIETVEERHHFIACHKFHHAWP